MLKKKVEELEQQLTQKVEELETKVKYCHVSHLQQVKMDVPKSPLHPHPIYS